MDGERERGGAVGCGRVRQGEERRGEDGKVSGVSGVRCQVKRRGFPKRGGKREKGSTLQSS